MIVHTCPACKKIVAKEDRRRKQPLYALPGAVLTQRDHEAPRVKCACGKVLILLKGAL